MASRDGRRVSRRPGRPPAPRYNIEKTPTRAVSKLLADAFDAADLAEDMIGAELKRSDLGPADRLLAIGQLVAVVKYRTTMACEVIATFGKRRAEEMLPEPIEPVGPKDDRTAGFPFRPGEPILPTAGNDEEPP